MSWLAIPVNVSLICERWLVPTWKMSATWLVRPPACTPRRRQHRLHRPRGELSFGSGGSRASASPYPLTQQLPERQCSLFTTLSPWLLSWSRIRSDSSSHRTLSRQRLIFERRSTVFAATVTQLIMRSMKRASSARRRTILDYQGKAAAAISVSGRADRMRRADPNKIGAILRAHALEISRQLGYQQRSLDGSSGTARRAQKPTSVCDRTETHSLHAGGLQRPQEPSRTLAGTPITSGLPI